MPTDLIKPAVLETLDHVYPPFLDLQLKLLAACRARGVDYFWIEGYRSPERQLALWQQGRNAAGAVTDPTRVVTKVKFGAHQVGIAADGAKDEDPKRKGLQIDWKKTKKADYAVLDEEARRLGLECGYSKWDWDYGHVQLPYESKGITLTMLRNLYQKGGLKAAWALLDRSGFGP